MLPCAAPPTCSLRKERSLAGVKIRAFDLKWCPMEPLRIAAVGENNGCIWNVAGGGASSNPVVFCDTEIMRCNWHPDGNVLLTGNAQGKIAVRSAADGKPMATLDAHEDEVYGIEVLSNEGLLAVGAGDTVQLWDLEKAERTAQVTLAATAGGVGSGAACALAAQDVPGAQCR